MTRVTPFWCPRASIRDKDVAHTNMRTNPGRGLGPIMHTHPSGRGLRASRPSHPVAKWFSLPATLVNQSYRNRVIERMSASQGVKCREVTA